MKIINWRNKKCIVHIHGGYYRQLIDYNVPSWQRTEKQYIDNMNTCVKRFDASQKGVEQAERGYMISQKRYDTGAGTLLEMNDSELALTQAKLNFNQAIYDYMVAKADLEKVLGQQEF
jgi:outer membrane protein TolC